MSKKKAQKKFEVSWAPTNTSKMTIEEMVDLNKQWDSTKKEYKSLLAEISEAVYLIEVAKDDLAYGHSKILRIILTEEHGAEKADQLIKSYIEEDESSVKYLQGLLTPLLDKKNELKTKLNDLQEKMQIKVVKTNG